MRSRKKAIVGIWRTNRDASWYSFLVHYLCLLPSRLSELFIVYDLFLLPISQCNSGIIILGCCGCSATALPCLCTRRSPQRLPDKCTWIHNTCGRGLYIDLLIPPRPHCDMNSMLHQFKCVMSPTRTGSSTYHIYDMVQHIAGKGQIWEAVKKDHYEWISVDLSLLMKIVVPGCFPTENYLACRWA